MDYSKAHSIRKQGLLSLIGEKKFGEGKGLGASVGGAISEKFKANATGIKESLDPLRLVKGITGKGTFGKVATTLAGRAFGRSDEDIKYFGGYARKKNKKDPQFATISSGTVTQLRSNDSIANVLGKMYNFMMKSHEEKVRNREIELAFRQDQIDKEDNRHKQLVHAILGKKTTATQAVPEQKKDEDGGIFSTIMKALKSILDNPFVAALLKDGLMAVGGMLVEAIVAAGPLLVLATALIGTKIFADWLREKVEFWKTQNDKKAGGNAAVTAQKTIDASKANQILDVAPEAAGALGSVDTSDLDQGMKEKASAIQRKQALVKQFLQERGYDSYRALGGFGPQYYSKDGSVTNTPPSKLMDDASDWADKQIDAQDQAAKLKPNAQTATPASASTPTPAAVPQATPSTTPAAMPAPAPTPMPAPAPMIPPVADAAPMAAGAPVVSVNNSVNNKAGRKDKIINPNTPNQRHDDILDVLAKSYVAI